MTDFAPIRQCLEENSSIYIFCHINPDADCTGAMIAMQRILTKSFGKKDVVMCSLDYVPKNLRFLKGASNINTLNMVDPAAKPDLALLVDCGLPTRVGKEFGPILERAGAIAVIDHHANNTGGGNINFIDSNASSTCEIIFRFCESIGITPDLDTATALYTGLMHDTGRFMHTNTNPEVFRIASKLVELGADPAAIATSVYNDRPVSHLKLLGYALANMKTHRDGEVAYAVLPREIFEPIGATGEDTEGIVEAIGAYDGCRANFSITITAEGLARVSMRSRVGLSVGKICEKFGGGGHAYAAGFRSRAAADTVVEMVLAQLDAAFDDADGKY